MGNNNIKNLVFDIGGVLVGFRVDDMLRDNGYDDTVIAEYHRCVLKDPLWAEFDLENQTFQEVVEEYVRRYPHLEEVIRWFMSHTERMTTGRPQVWEKVHALKQAGYRIYLLSNYSSEFFRTQIAHLPFMADIDGKVVSYEIHEIKPNRGIYGELVSRYGLEKEECLFFDDKAENVAAAKDFGMCAQQVLSEASLMEMLEKCMADRADLC